MKPYAVHLLERFEAGETVEELAVKEGIPIDRIRMRLAAAAEFARIDNARAETMCNAKRAA
jgi:hypothetical protein